MPCLRSGMCCRVIVLEGSDRSPDAIRDLADRDLDQGRVDTDALFISRNWQPITEAEALAVNPSALLWVSRSRSRGERVYLYRCEQLDEATDLCRAHEVKPHVCSGYPFYDGRADGIGPRGLLWPGCGYVDEAIEKQAAIRRDQEAKEKAEALEESAET